MLLPALVGWLNQRQQNGVAYLVEENRILRGHVRGRIRLTDAERRRSGRRGVRRRRWEPRWQRRQTLLPRWAEFPRPSGNLD